MEEKITFRWILHEIKFEIKFLFLNYFVSYFPIWIVRKFFYYLFGMRIGKGSRLLVGVKVYEPEKIRIGRNTIVNDWCYLDGRGGITIGDNVTIATYSKLITGAHNIDDDNFSYQDSAITIGNNVAVFSDSVVLGGANINDGCIFSAKSLVRKGLYERNGIYAGNPAKFIRYRKSNCNYKQWWPTIFR